MNRKRILHYKNILILAWLVTVLPAESQEVTVTATADSSQLIIGNWMTVQLEARRPSSVSLVWPSFADTLGPFSIVKIDSAKPVSMDGAVVEKRIITVSAYDPGVLQIPSIAVIYRQTGDTSVRTAFTSPLSVTVTSIEIDSTKGLRDIKPPLTIPLTWQEILMVAGLVVALAAAVYGIYYYRKKKKRAIEEIDPEKPRIPPHVTALVKLKDLDERRVWQQGDVKGFYCEATDILREYFEGRYGVMALEMTTEEIMGQLHRRIDAPEILRKISSLLDIADLVKFAKYITATPENESVIPRSLEIVETTKPKEIVAEHV